MLKNAKSMYKDKDQLTQCITYTF